MAQLDLTPFGFTTTESRVFAALLELGPATGYAVARASHLARANAYGALDGLVTRGAAIRTPGRPAHYRPVDPQALVARLASEQGEALDRLERALRGVPRGGDPETRAVQGARALATLVLQLVARAATRVEGVVEAELFRATLPAWRRAAGRATLDLRVTGEPPPEAAALGVVGITRDAPTVILIDGMHIVAANGSPAALGIWTSHPALVALARLAIEALA